MTGPCVGKKLLFRFAIVATILIVLRLIFDGGAKFEIGPDTTVVSGPLDADGFIDYEAALNGMLGEGVTPVQPRLSGSLVRWSCRRDRCW